MQADGFYLRVVADKGLVNCQLTHASMRLAVLRYALESTGNSDIRSSLRRGRAPSDHDVDSGLMLGFSLIKHCSSCTFMELTLPPFAFEYTAINLI